MYFLLFRGLLIRALGAKSQEGRLLEEIRESMFWNYGLSRKMNLVIGIASGSEINFLFVF